MTESCGPAGLPVATRPPPISRTSTTLRWARVVVFGVAAVALLGWGVVAFVVPHVRAGMASTAPGAAMLLGMFAVCLALSAWPDGTWRTVRDDPARLTVYEPLRTRVGNALYGFSAIGIGVLQVLLVWAGGRGLGIAVPALCAAAVVATCLYAVRLHRTRLTLSPNGVEYTDTDGRTTGVAWGFIVGVCGGKRGTVEIHPHPMAAWTSSDGIAWRPPENPHAPIVVRATLLPVRTDWLIGVLQVCISRRRGP